MSYVEGDAHQHVKVPSDVWGSGDDAPDLSRLLAGEVHDVVWHTL